MTTSELLFFEGYTDLLPLYEALHAFLTETYGDAFSVKVTKTQISLRNCHVFAAVSLPLHRRRGWPERYLLLSLGLGAKRISPRIRECVEPYPGRWTHHIPLTREAELDEELRSWLQDAWVFAENK